ncbi:hypothetical protein N7478_006946 [Penicillium angulare]|uniref:uncharacterized protein n=1 Tax=Penicillium angulare TaxID=116970 RepID=UPI0025404A3E|nr:uncharacterized protein N7478_006946 [Penicillium angulare]KAJ5281574.1 hypothetical protein N7478_006946 [Penicillium angulare]
MLLKYRQLIVPQQTFFRSLYNSNFKEYATAEFLNSASAKFVNPRSHLVASDKVSQTFDAEILAGLDDRKVLSLFTLGFFGGFVLSIERLFLKAGAWRLLPVGFTSVSTITL